MAAYHVVRECVVEQWLGVRRTTHTDDLYTIILKIYYTVHFMLLNSKYVHNVFTVLLPNF